MGKETDLSTSRGGADRRTETSGAAVRGSGRNPRERGDGAARLTAGTERSESGTERLMETVVERRNMHAAWKQVKRNKGAAGVDGQMDSVLRIGGGERGVRKAGCMDTAKAAPHHPATMETLLYPSQSYDASGD